MRSPHCVEQWTFREKDIYKEQALTLKVRYPKTNSFTRAGQVLFDH